MLQSSGRTVDRKIRITGNSYDELAAQVPSGGHLVVVVRFKPDSLSSVYYRLPGVRYPVDSLEAYDKLMSWDEAGEFEWYMLPPLTEQEVQELKDGQERERRYYAEEARKRAEANAARLASRHWYQRMWDRFKI